ncbi:MAG: DUF2281 domain-containing protein [Treponema sp.]|nr:DUF2281 domain-containing protein [Treponema sp.]
MQIQLTSVIFNSDSTKNGNNKRQPGGLTGKFWMADDFDETPECFKDYL